MPETPPAAPSKPVSNGYNFPMPEPDGHFYFAMAGFQLATFPNESEPLEEWANEYHAKIEAEKYGYAPGFPFPDTDNELWEISVTGFKPAPVGTRESLRVAKPT